MREGAIKVADDLSPTQRQFLEAACGMADRFNEYQVDEKALMNRLGFDEGKFSRVRNELEDAGYLTRKGAPQASEVGAFWIERAGIDLCPEPLGGRDALQTRG
jgi:hypothetical protein